MIKETFAAFVRVLITFSLYLSSGYFLPTIVALVFVTSNHQVGNTNKREMRNACGGGEE